MASISVNSCKTEPTPALGFQEVVGQSRGQDVNVDVAVRNAPIALTRIRPLDRLSVRTSEFPQRRISLLAPLPSLPQQLSDSSPNPLDCRIRPRFVFRKFEILTPTSKLLVQRLFHR